MNRNLKIIVFFLFLSSILLASIPWGFYAHKRVNRYDVFTLPEELVGFYKKQIDHLTVHAVDADKKICLENLNKKNNMLTSKEEQKQ